MSKQIWTIYKKFSHARNELHENLARDDPTLASVPVLASNIFTKNKKGKSYILPLQI